MKEEFIKELKALLKKYGAQIELEDVSDKSYITEIAMMVDFDPYDISSDTLSLGSFIDGN